MHFGFGSPGSLAQGPTTSPLVLIRFQSPSGCDLLNQLRKSSVNNSSISMSSFIPFGKLKSDFIQEI
jgi:hypothetical protein